MSRGSTIPRLCVSDAAAAAMVKELAAIDTQMLTCAAAVSSALSMLTVNKAKVDELYAKRHALADEMNRVIEENPNSADERSMVVTAAPPMPHNRFYKPHPFPAIASPAAPPPPAPMPPAGPAWGGSWHND